MDSKSITVGYGIFNNPHNKRINKQIKKWGKKGYRLAHRQDNDVGCLHLLFTFGWARGRTMLTFIKDD